MINQIIFIITVGLGILLNIYFYADIILSLYTSAIIMIYAFFFSLRESISKKKLGLVFVSLMAFYAPLSSLLSYINFNFELDQRENMFGLDVNPYMFDQKIVELSAMIGSTSVLGILFGLIIANLLTKPIKINSVKSELSENTLSLLSYSIWLSCGFLLSWLSTPNENVLTAAYTTSESPLHNANFSSAWMLSYCIIIFTYSDYRFEENLNIKKIKGNLFLLIFLIIIIFHQILRGDRESFTMIVGMFIGELFYIKKSNFKKIILNNKLLIVLLLSFLLIITNIVGLFRSALVLVSDINSLFEITINLHNQGMLDFSRFFQGTWNAVFLTQLSIAGDYINGFVSTKFGKDYIDLILSLPPGFIADLFGYVRPWTSESNPAWEMTYGIGGWYFTVLPFNNFQLPGVFLITAIIFIAISLLDRHLHNNYSKGNLAIYLIILMAIPHWFWYGEKAIVNALIMSYLLNFIYKLNVNSKNNYSNKSCY